MRYISMKRAKQLISEISPRNPPRVRAWAKREIMRYVRKVR